MAMGLGECMCLLRVGVWVDDLVLSDVCEPSCACVCVCVCVSYVRARVCVFARPQGTCSAICSHLMFDGWLWLDLGWGSNVFRCMSSLGVGVWVWLCLYLGQ